MRRLGLFFVLAICMLTIWGCSGGGIFITPASQKDALTYIIGSNGRDSVVFTPASTGGNTGTYIISRYSYAWPTSTTYNSGSGNYTAKTWYQTGGTKGSYSYDSTKMLLTLTTTQLYRVEDSAYAANASPAQGVYFETDYSWIDFSDVDSTAGWAKNNPDAYTQTQSFTAAFTQDNLLGGVWENFVDNGSIYTQNLTTASSVSLMDAYIGGLGLLYVQDATDKEKWSATISATLVDNTVVTETFNLIVKSATISMSSSYIRKPAGAISTGYFNYLYEQTAKLDKLFITGAELGDYTASWKSGNIVTFFATQTSELIRTWKGTSQPSDLPTVSGTTGIGSSLTISSTPARPYRAIGMDTSTGYLTDYIYQNLSSVPVNLVLGNQGTYLYSATSTWAGRSISQ